MALSLLRIPLRNKEFNKDKIRRGVEKKKHKPRKREIKKKKRKTNIMKNGRENKKEKKPQGIARRLV
jgi:hypothetical protein